MGEAPAQALLQAGVQAEHAGDIARAAAAYRAAIAAEPGLVAAHVNLAGVLWRLADFDGTLAHARQSVALAPEHAYAQRILGTALLQRNALGEAERHLRRALELLPGFPLAQLDLALTLLLAGRLDEGWPLYAQRWSDPRHPRPAFFHPAREWAGPRVPLQGRTLAVYGEQGRGDVLQALRYLPQLQSLGARVVCVVVPELVPLVEASFPGVACLRPGQSLQVDLHAAAMDLPARFGTTLANIPSRVPYLRAPEAARRAWRERLGPPDGRLRIGFAWCGSHGQVNNRNRAMPLSLLAPLARLAGVQGFSLQKGDAGPWTDVAPQACGLADFTPDWRDFGDSAALVEQLDGVITVDTAIAHLAGALGKPVWILLPPNPDWRWLLDRADSPWYPTARLFRRGLEEDRSAQVERVREALACRLRGGDEGRV
jgi:tetratricopeptide (TPR) repeat protein